MENWATDVIAPYGFVHKVSLVPADSTGNLGRPLTGDEVESIRSTAKHIVATSHGRIERRSPKRAQAKGQGSGRTSQEGERTVRWSQQRI